jgi:hypothetical protein
MTRFEPTLIVKRLVVERNSRAVYDENFHEGMNIIRGENSSGKSTVLNFIFYGLGGDLSDWSEVALLCSRVFVVVELNGKIAITSREISADRGQPMDIFGGDFEDAKKAPRDEWVRYPYARSRNKESFSQAIFRLLGLPEVASEMSGNLTIHQILRLLYADQLSPVESLFRYESAFDPPVLRDAIGRLLCGAYDPALYENELRIKSLQREFDGVSGELKSLFEILGRVEQGLTLDWIAGQRRVLEEERAELQVAIEVEERKLFTGTESDQLSLASQDEAYAEVKRLQEVLGEAIQERDGLQLNVADSAAFIASLESKIEALTDAASVEQYVGAITFQVCPCCYAPLESEPPAHACYLCKTPFDSERSKHRIVALINDTAIQLKQSRMLQERREERAVVARTTVQKLQDQWRHASRKLAELQRLPSTEARIRLRSLNHQAGYLERKIENLEERAREVEVIDRLSRQKEELNAEIARLKSQNEAMRLAQEKRLSRSYTAVADEVRHLLRNDLRRQDSFENPQSIEFDFAANRISVDGQTYFSASSRVILKSSFFLAFLAASTKHGFFRHPRFCIIDTIEDKGMEPQRSHNFQLQIARVSNESKVQHQIIFATAMIAPDLDDERFTIGKFSTRDDPTIAIES